MWRVEWKGRWGRWVWEDETSACSALPLPGVPLGPVVPLPNRAARRRLRRRMGEIEARVRAALMHCAMDPGELETLAEDAVRKAEMAHLWFPLAELMAIRLKFFVYSEPGLAGCGHEGLTPDVLTVRSSKDDRRWTLSVLHELAHALLRRSGKRFLHGDVWALTLALAIPRRSVRHLHAAIHVPAWARDLRRRTARAVPRG